MIKIGLPKGVVKSRSLEIIRRYAGEIKNEKTMFYPVGGLCFFLLKHRDIPVFIEHGWLDFGVTSTEWLIEQNVNLEIVKKLDWCNTRISLLATESTLYSDEPYSTCVTEFPRIADLYAGKIGRSLRIHAVSGSCEGMVPNIFDFCIDCVETGETLRANQLEEFIHLIDTQTVVVCHSKQVATFRNLVDSMFS